MAAPAYLQRIAGGFQRTTTVTTGGVGNAEKIASLNAAGVFDASLFPAGLGQEISTLPASEALAAGNQVNLWNDAGTVKVRKADAASGKRSDGFVLAAVASGASAATYRGGGLNTGVSGLTVGADYFLGANGVVTTTQNVTAGQIDQYIGTATAAGVLDQLAPQLPVLNA